MIRAHTASDVDRMRQIWNQVFEAGDAFPQTELLDDRAAATFFASQSAAAVA